MRKVVQIMAATITGVRELQRNLRRFTPHLFQNMNDAIRRVMVPIRDHARSFVESAPPAGLSHWSKGGKAITSATTYRAFPEYNAATIRSGIFYSRGMSKANRAGFSMAYYVGNKSAIGAIYETAGRKHPHGREQFPRGKNTPKNYRHTTHSDGLGGSLNPNAGKQFVGALPRLYDAKPRTGSSRGRPSAKSKGRLIFRAWAQDQGKVNAAVINEIESAALAFNRGQML
jgi:hypothetical protein